MSNAVVEMNGYELSEAIHAKKVSCREVMAAYLDQIEKVNPRVNAIVTMVDGDDLLRQADEKDKALAAGDDQGWMHGFPQAVKDLAATKGIRTTKGAVVLKDWVPDYDEPQVTDMKNAGAIVIGKTNTPEYGYGSQTYNEVFGATGNPYDESKTSGGSSGGAACAVALRMQAVADGSDYMGSLRNPAGYCNVFGYRPSLGCVPADAAEQFTNTMMAVGPMARTVADIALLLGTLAGYNTKYPLTKEADWRLKALTPKNVHRALEKDPKGTRVAWLGDWGGKLPMEAGVMDTCKVALDNMASVGVKIDEIEPFYDMDEFWEKIWLPIRHYSASALKPIYDQGKGHLLKPEAQWEYEGSVNENVHTLFDAFARRTDFYNKMMKIYENYDFIVTPSAAVFPFDKNIHWPEEIAGCKMQTYHNWMEIVTPWTMGGNAIIAVPAGFGGANHLSIGLQLVAAPRKDFELLQFARAYEQVNDFVGRFPPEY